MHFSIPLRCFSILVLCKHELDGNIAVISAPKLKVVPKTQRRFKHKNVFCVNPIGYLKNKCFIHKCMTDRLLLPEFFLVPLPVNSMSKTQQLCVMNVFSHYVDWILPLYIRPPVTATLPVESGRAVETLTGQRLKSYTLWFQIQHLNTKCFQHPFLEMIPALQRGWLDKRVLIEVHWRWKMKLQYTDQYLIYIFYLLTYLQWRIGSQITVSGKHQAD